MGINKGHRPLNAPLSRDLCQIICSHTSWVLWSGNILTWHHLSPTPTMWMIYWFYVQPLCIILNHDGMQSSTLSSALFHHGKSLCPSSSFIALNRWGILIHQIRILQILDGTPWTPRMNKSLNHCIPVGPQVSPSLKPTQLTLSNENRILQVCWRRVVIVHLVGDKNNEPGKQTVSGYCAVL